MDDLFSPAVVAKRLGYPLPVTAFGLVRWEGRDSSDYVVATTDGQDVFLVEVFQRNPIQDVQNIFLADVLLGAPIKKDVRLARLVVPFDGSFFDGSIFGLEPKDVAGPAFVVNHLAKIIETMGTPVYMDSDFPSSSEEDEVH